MVLAVAVAAATASALPARLAPPVVVFELLFEINFERIKGAPLRLGGTYLLGPGAVGEFGPILLVTLFLSTDHPFREAVILIAFILLPGGIALLSMGVVWRGWSALERTMETSKQHLDLLLGGFVAGMITPASASSSRSSSSTAA
jgi:hypothetical protein